MKYCIAILLFLFFGLTATALASQLDPAAAGMAVGVIFGVLAPLPAVLMVLAVNRRGADDDGDSLPAWRQQGAIVLDAPAQPDAPRVAREATPSLEAALYAVPGLVARPPQAGNGNAVIVASADEEFVAAVRAAVRGIHGGGDIHLVAGIAPAPPAPPFDPQRVGRYLWRECWRDGALLGPEPRRQCDINALRMSSAYYWIVRPAGDGEDDLALGLPGAPAVLPPRRPTCVVRSIPPGAL